MNLVSTNQVEEYLKRIDSLEAFRNCEISHSSRRHEYGPISHRLWATAIEWLAKLASESNAMAQVVRGIGMPPLYQSKGEMCAALYRAALSVLSLPYDDVVGRSGPDAGRFSDHQRDWTVSQKVLVFAYLRRATAEANDTAYGYGWGILEAAKVTNTHIPYWEGVKE